MLSRRHLAKVSFASVIACAAFGRSNPAAAKKDAFAPLAGTFAGIERESGGRLGVFVLDTRSGASVGHRAGERFPMCSTFKLLAVAAILAKVDGGEEQLARRLEIKPSDILAYAPVSKQHVGDGLSIGELCEAAITLSDNTAANLLLASLGGPQAVTRFARSIGDRWTRLDRIEPDLNEAEPGDPRDTTTPDGMARTVAGLTTGAALKSASRDQLIAWLIACKTGDAKLRAGLPKAWRIGDKTGGGGHGSSNDVAVIWPEGRPAVVVAAYLTETTVADDKRNAVHAAIGRAVAGALAG